MNAEDTFKSSSRIENRRHTNAHQLSPPSQQQRIQSPPLRQISPNCIQRRDFCSKWAGIISKALGRIQDNVLANCWPESDEAARRVNAGCLSGAVRGRSTPSPKLNSSCRQDSFACLSSSIPFCIFSAASSTV